GARPGDPMDEVRLSTGFDLKNALKNTADEADSLAQKLPEHYEGEVLVKLRPGLADKLLDDFASRYGATLLERFDIPDQIYEDFGGDLLHLRLPDGMSTAQAIAAMGQDPLVKYAASNDVLTALDNVPNDLDNRLWGMRKIDGPAAWDVSTGQRENGPIVCVIDTGVDYNHPDLRNNMWVNTREIPGNGQDDDGNGVVDDVHGYNAFADNGNPLDDHSHGSHCAGSIAAEGNNGQGVVGVNWQGRVMAAKFLSSSGSGSTAGAIKAVLYATKMGARITSNSWGGGGFSQPLYDALKASPALHIFAAGNESNDNDKSPAYPASYDLPNLISVAALDRNDRLASFSNWGASSVDIGAPGVDIYSTTANGRYGTMSGTSMACPHVAGVATLVASAFPNATNQEIRDRILQGAIPIPALEGKSVTGGRLNAKNAVETDTTPPATPGDLAASGASHRRFQVGWTAPGDDGNQGLCSAYDLRWSHQPITEENFARATPVPTGKPATPGTAENVGVDLTPSGQERTVYVGLKAIDNAGNASGLATAAVTIPAARVAFEDNLDQGPAKWTPAGTWGLVDVPGRGKVWTDSPGGNYQNKKDMAVATRSFMSLAGLKGSTLFFDCKYQIEARHDNLFVEVSRDGRRWSEVARFSGDSDWRKQAVDLSAYDGQDVKVRFRMKTDRSITFDGFYLDNVAVAGESAR
ncbi:MAG: S8 family serine peptidase, partial [Candidatus Eremiobacterota bacterium]